MSYPVIEVAGVDQLQRSVRPDLVPADPAARRSAARVAAFDAVVYGLPAVYQYAQMSRQHLAAGLPLGAFVHERRLARPGFAAFRVPNVDTLYSNTWLDLRAGPVQVDLPDFGDRYYTLHLLDIFSNSANISRRTVGEARRLWLVPPGWRGSVPRGVVRLEAGSRLMWVLMRIQVSGDAGEVHRLQDAVRIAPADGGSAVIGGEGALGAAVDPDEVTRDWKPFLRGLDAALRLGGVPEPDVPLVRRFALLGLDGGETFAPERLDAEVRAGIADGFEDARRVVDACRPQLGEPVGTGWTRVADKGAHGANHLSRAVMNHVGLAANVVEENTSFNTYADGTGRRLDGSTGRYVVRLATPPPAGAFWSVTLYDDAGLLVENPVDRYAVGSATDGLVVDADGSVTIAIAPAPPGDGRGGNWLPCPRGGFFLVLRIYQPLEEVLDGGWLPGPVEPLPELGAATDLS